MTVAVLLPVTFTLDPISAFIMFGGIYYGAMHGGSTTSILLNTPGETSAIATALDGHMMARQGRGAAALTTAAIGSFVAGTLATIALTFFAPPLAKLALRFGPAEYFALTVVAFAAVAVLLGDSVIAASSAFSRTRAGPGGNRSAHRQREIFFGSAAARRHRHRHSRHRTVRRRRDHLPGLAAWT